MSLRSTIKTLVTDRVAASRGPLNRWKASRYGLDALSGRAPTLDLYYEAGDPHSHLCAQWLRANHHRLEAPVSIRMVAPPAAETYPEEQRQRAMAMLDASRIAPACGLNWSSTAQLPDAANRLRAGRVLTTRADNLESWLASEATVSARLFAGETLDDTLAADADAIMRRNHQRRTRLGHYLPAMWQYQGDWFWALGRMNYLEAALRNRAAIRDSNALLNIDTSHYRLPEARPDGSVEFFFSFRSPYSYLAAQQVREEYRDWPTSLTMRPVLPMAMRGMKIPRAKGFYIVRDVFREAQRLDIPFGHIADPIGAGAQRCLQVFPLAQGTEQQLEFCYQAAKAIWSEAMDVATDDGLRQVCERSGIDWQAAQRNLLDTSVLDYADNNRQALLAAGAWGVPTFCLGDFVCWGNDRLPMLRTLLAKPSAAKVAQTG